MDKFWKWMKDKKYGELKLKNRVNKYYWYYELGRFIGLKSFPKQMLIGYMLEYIKCSPINTNCRKRLDHIYSHTNIYQELEDIINLLEEFHKLIGIVDHVEEKDVNPVTLRENNTKRV